MQRIMFPGIETGKRGLGRRMQIAVSIADAVTSVLPYLKDNIEWNPLLSHRLEHIDVSWRYVTEDELKRVSLDFEQLLAKYMKLHQELREESHLKMNPNWSDEITTVYWDLSKAIRVMDIHEIQQKEPRLSVPVHVARIGDLAIATNPFGLYVDYGMRIKARSKAVQTFIVQLANGYYIYLPTERSITGGAYGSNPEVNEVGPEGGYQLVEGTLALIESLWRE